MIAVVLLHNGNNYLSKIGLRDVSLFRTLSRSFAKLDIGKVITNMKREP